MKVSVSIPDDDMAFLEAQIAAGRFPGRSAAVHAAIRSLRERELDAEYAASNREWRESGDADDWDALAGDGLDA